MIGMRFGIGWGSVVGYVREVWLENAREVWLERGATKYGK